MEGEVLFMVLDLHGAYYMAPSYTAFDSIPVFLPEGLAEVEILPEFTWPHGAGSFSEAQWLSALTDKEMTELLSNIDQFQFGWAE